MVSSHSHPMSYIVVPCVVVCCSVFRRDQHRRKSWSELGGEMGIVVNVYIDVCGCACSYVYIYVNITSLADFSSQITADFSSGLCWQRREACMYVYVYIFLCMCMCTEESGVVYTHMYTRICAYTYVRVHIYVYKYMCVYSCMYMCLYIYTM